ncbi:hypothetical protein [Desulfitibacter alkalitolerans]|uniref:hypothetical protein n=1 Tax=Desulfitibacter alkalitolerans TaxID=264641 RepID=UPI00048798ED|nr:hypothetical protein [Desulfitibacter alkalitolerans]
MLRLFMIIIFCLLFLSSGCYFLSNEPEDVKPSVNLGKSYDFSKEFVLETRITPKLVDKSFNYITREFEELDGLYRDNFWTPVCFLDNDNFLYLARLPKEDNFYMYRYNLKTKKIDRLFQDVNDYAQNLYIKNTNNFAVVDHLALVLIKNDELDKQILFPKQMIEEQINFEVHSIVAHPYTGNVLIQDKEWWYLTDLNFKDFSKLTFKENIYRACWVDEENLILGAFDDIEKYKGSSIITYNISKESKTKTYIGDDKFFIDPYRNNENYCGFTYINDYTGPPHGTIGIIDYSSNKLIFLELENVAYLSRLQGNLVAASVADSPIDWNEWGRTTEGTVNLCVYDVATDTYVIRGKNLSRENRNVIGDNIIISPDGSTLIYHSLHKHYISYPKNNIFKNIISYLKNIYEKR